MAAPDRGLGCNDVRSGRNDALSGYSGNNALAAGAAAFSVLTIFFPIDTLKTHMQTQGVGMWHAIQSILRSGSSGGGTGGAGGTLALYRGFSMAVTEHTANRMLLFGGSTFIKQHCTSPSWPEPFRDAAGGMGAGLGKTMLLHPLDTIKTRWQLSQPARPLSQRALLDFVSGLYRGVAPAAIRSAVGMAIWLTARNFFEESLPSHLYLRHFISGFLASTTNDICTFPLDTLKKNLQSVRAGAAAGTANGSGAAVCTKGANTCSAGSGNAPLVHVARRLWREGGPMRFYRGISPQLIRRGLDGGLLNWLYMRIKCHLDSDGGSSKNRSADM
mmetsp:Transcript_17066/g.43834  ORF Transcript_17066/g.43834 Transcript_17066/m.43834 type:complete len:330 (+) Transcript_17066:72-1061(+)